MPLLTGPTPNGKIGSQRVRDLKHRIIEMQDALRLVILDVDAKPIERASCARSWDLLQERLRVLAGHVKPGSRNVSVSEQPEKKRRSGRVIEPVPMSPEQVAKEMKIA